jgi:hypothetical protein
MITNSLEWVEQELSFKRRAIDLVQSRDVLRMIEGISLEVKELSKAEVMARRGKRKIADDLLIRINQDIEMVEEYILVAKLLG